MAKPVILVTGGAGYIGSHICKLLSVRGYLPVVYDNLSEGYAENVKWGPLEIGDLRDPERLREVFKQYKPIAVMHFAALALVGESMSNPAKYYDNNLISTITLLKTMLEFEVKSLVFSSTCATYGVPETETLGESHPQNPINPYGKSKLMIETMLKDCDRAYGFKSVSLRYFNAAGADLDGEIGEKHNPETHLIPLVIQAALGQRENITVFGTDFPTADGSAVRDYIHVRDLAEAHLKALEYLQPREDKKSLFLNLGTGTGFSVLEIIAKVKEYTGKEFTVKYADRREGDPPRLVASNGEALKRLDFELKYSDLKTIILSAFNWHQKLLEQNAVLRDSELRDIEKLAKAKKAAEIKEKVTVKEAGE